jgi:hypothetical protein
MTQREAKREACWRAASVLRNSLDAGWDVSVLFPDPEDEQRFLAAPLELIKELERRGWK